MRLFLTAKHWQIFIVLSIGYLLANVDLDLGWPRDIRVALNITGFLISFVWHLAVGHGLYGFLPARVEMKYNLFVINWFVLIVTYCAVLILSEGMGMIFRGVGAIPLFYFFYAFVHVLIFPGRLLRSIEMGKQAHFGDYILTVVSMMIWPVGIWFVQPRINEVVMEQAGTEN
jgi:hypothetical protein